MKKFKVAQYEDFSTVTIGVDTLNEAFEVYRIFDKLKNMQMSYIHIVDLSTTRVRINEQWFKYQVEVYTKMKIETYELQQEVKKIKGFEEV